MSVSQDHIAEIGEIKGSPGNSLIHHKLTRQTQSARLEVHKRREGGDIVKSGEALVIDQVSG